MTGFHVIGIGNAIIDVIQSTEDQDLIDMGVQKGIMQLVERERSEFLLAQQARRGQGAAGAGRICRQYPGRDRADGPGNRLYRPGRR